MNTASPPRIFSPRRRQLASDRAAGISRTAPGAQLFLDHMDAELAARLDWVKADFKDALVIGHLGPSLDESLKQRGVSYVRMVPGAGAAAVHGAVRGDEDHPRFEQGSFDLVIANGTLDSVNDLPGALILLRRALRKGGHFMGAFVGATSLPKLKSIMLAADDDRVSQRIHPQIDVRAAGDLLARCGFASPVSDAETLTVRYRSLDQLVRDLRAHGWTSQLANSAPPLGKAALARARSAFDRLADDDGRLSETLVVNYLSGWTSQPV